MDKIVKRKGSQISLLTRSKQLGLSKTLNELIYCDSEPSFALLRKDYGETDVRLMLLQRVQLLLKRVGGELDDKQIEYLIKDIILKEFYHYNVSDINLIERRIAGLKIFGKVKIQDIISQFELHDVERTEMAMMRSKNKDQDTEQRKVAAIPKEVKEELHNMLDKKIKKKAQKINNPPPLSKEVIKANNKKIETLKKLYKNTK